MNDRLRILVVVGLLTGESLREEDRAARQLISSLRGLCRDSEFTVLSIDPRSPARSLSAYRDAGVTVLGDTGDWVQEVAGAPFSYSHLFCSASVGTSGAFRRLSASEPQATKVLYFSSLPFRAVAALVPITPIDEREGLEYVQGQAEMLLVDEARGVDALWCEREQDAAFLAGRLPDVPVAVVPPTIERLGAEASYAERRGVVVVATEGHDVLGGNEDAALLALREILPAVPRGGNRVDCTLVTSWPSPMLESAAAHHGVTIVPSGDLVSTLRHAKVVLVTHGYGSGGGAIVHSAMAAGTPFVATSLAVSGLHIGHLMDMAVSRSPSGMVQRVRRLVEDEGEWKEFAAALDDVSRYGAQVRERALRAALPGLGIVPLRRAATTMEVELGPWRRALRQSPVALRPEGMAPPVASDGPQPADPVARYQRWCERFGPTPSVLEAIKAEVRQCSFLPTISILMPVYNTDADILLATVDSVRSQIYVEWQLCVADDGSDRPETLEVLRDIGADPRVKITRLGGQSGISAATNAALTMATGEWVTFLDHDDLLKPHALAQVVRWLNADPTLDLIYSDEDKLDKHGQLVQPHLKPDWSPDQLMSQNYVCHLAVARRALVEEIGGLRPEYDGSQGYDLVLRLAERSEHIAHIPEPLYTWRMVAESTAAVVDAKPYAFVAARRALDDALRRRGYRGQAEETSLPGHFRTRYSHPGTPRVTIIIPTKDRLDLLRRCVDSVIDRSTYSNFEILIIDNQSADGATLEYLAEFPGRVIRYPHWFNYARMMNLGARVAGGDALLFLNNDTEVISPDWIEAFLEHAMRPEVGAVGGRLYWGDGRLQHEGILVGVKGWATNVDHKGYRGRGEVVRNVSAVTGACMMMRPSVYWAVGGNDERLRIAYNDVDICLRIRQAGLHVVYTPHARLFHNESSSRSGYEHRDDGPLFGFRWQPRERVDPYYSPLLDPDQPFQIKL